LSVFGQNRGFRGFWGPKKDAKKSKKGPFLGFFSKLTGFFWENFHGTFPLWTPFFGFFKKYYGFHDTDSAGDYKFRKFGSSKIYGFENIKKTPSVWAKTRTGRKQPVFSAKTSKTGLFGPFWPVFEVLRNPRKPPKPVVLGVLGQNPRILQNRGFGGFRSKPRFWPKTGVLGVFGVLTGSVGFGGFDPKPRFWVILGVLAYF
jgi:hypothetical protein